MPNFTEINFSSLILFRETIYNLLLLYTTKSKYTIRSSSENEVEYGWETIEPICLRSSKGFTTNCLICKHLFDPPSPARVPSLAPWLGGSIPFALRYPEIRDGIAWSIYNSASLGLKITANLALFQLSLIYTL